MCFFQLQNFAIFIVNETLDPDPQHWYHKLLILPQINTSPRDQYQSLRKRLSRQAPGFQIVADELFIQAAGGDNILIDRREGESGAGRHVPVRAVLPPPRVAKGQSHEIFCFWFFYESVSRFPPAQTSVADPDPPDPHVLGLPDPYPLVRGIDPDPDPDPSIIMQK